ncbi:MAG: hypothetical protein K2H68_07090, partial [Bacteroidales bacterium]|nr:hypothetical protein [Bacteroidales bacterium]
MENLPQKLLENAVEELNRLPGIGRRTALRLALFLLSQEESMVEKFSETLVDFRTNIKYCKICHNISDQIGYPTPYELPPFIPEGSDAAGGNMGGVGDRDPLFED